MSVWFILKCCFSGMFEYTQTQISWYFLLICDESIFTRYEHINVLERMQIKRGLNSFYSPNTKRELYLSALPIPTIIDQE